MKRLFMVLMFLVLVLAVAGTSYAAMVQGIPDNGKAQYMSGNFKTGDTYKARLYITANTVMSIATTTNCSATGELSGGNYAAASLSGVTVTTDTTNHYAIWSMTSPSWSNLTAAHVDGMAICDYTSPNDVTNGTLVAYFTFTDTPTTAGTLQITVPAAAYNTGLITWH